MLNYVSERCWIDYAYLYGSNIDSDIDLIDTGKVFFFYVKKITIVILMGILPLKEEDCSGRQPAFFLKKMQSVWSSKDCIWDQMDCRNGQICFLAIEALELVFFQRRSGRKDWAVWRGPLAQNVSKSFDFPCKSTSYIYTNGPPSLISGSVARLTRL